MNAGSAGCKTCDFGCNIVSYIGANSGDICERAPGEPKTRSRRTVGIVLAVDSASGRENKQRAQLCRKQAHSEHSLMPPCPLSYSSISAIGTKRTCRLHCAIRSQGQSGKHMLALSFSGFDPFTRPGPTADLVPLHSKLIIRWRRRLDTFGLACLVGALKQAVANHPAGQISETPRGGVNSSLGLQMGQGMPAPPQPQACGPSRERSGWHSQTQRQSATSENQLLEPLERNLSEVV